MYKIEISERTLHFKQPAGTSRGVYTTRHSYYLTLTSDELPGVEGVGECATLPDLSCDAKPEYAVTLRQVCQMVEQMGRIPYDMIRAYPSITFGLETAFASFFTSPTFSVSIRRDPCGGREDFLQHRRYEAHSRDSGQHLIRESSRY